MYMYIPPLLWKGTLMALPSYPACMHKGKAIGFVFLLSVIVVVTKIARS